MIKRSPLMSTINNFLLHQSIQITNRKETHNHKQHSMKLIKEKMTILNRLVRESSLESLRKLIKKWQINLFLRSNLAPLIGRRVMIWFRAVHRLVSLPKRRKNCSSTRSWTSSTALTISLITNWMSLIIR